MALPYRICRAFSSMFAQILAIFGFSFLLTWIFILYQPSPGPGVVQRLGWQSWDVITMPAENNHIESTNTSTDSGAGASDPLVNGPEQVDWWNVTAPESKVDSSNFPLDVWAPLLPHNTGCTSDALLLRMKLNQYSSSQCPKLLSRNATFGLL